MIFVLGAYGRRYSDLDDAKKDWNAGKDFRMSEGSYINKSDWSKYANSQPVYFEQTTPTSVKGSFEESFPYDRGEY